MYQYNLYIIRCSYESVLLPLLLTGFMKLHIGLVVLMKKMSVINFLLQNINLVSVQNFAGHVWQDWRISWNLYWCTVWFKASS